MVERWRHEHHGWTAAGSNGPSRRAEMAPAADRGNHHCMAMTIKQLRAASDDDLIEAHDEVASYTEATYGGSVRSRRGCVGVRRLAGPGVRRQTARPRPADPPGRRSCAGGGSESTAGP